MGIGRVGWRHPPDADPTTAETLAPDIDSPPPNFARRQLAILHQPVLRSLEAAFDASFGLWGMRRNSGDP
jgi:hypothetical protein